MKLKHVILSVLISYAFFFVVEDHIRLLATAPMASVTTAALSNLVTVAPTNSTVNDFLRGILQGARSGIAFEDLNQTYINTTLLSSNITAAVSEFQGNTSDKIVSALNRIGFLTKFLYQIAVQSNMPISDPDAVQIKLMNQVLRSVGVPNVTFRANVSLVVFNATLTTEMSHGTDFPLLTYNQAGQRFGNIMAMVTYDGTYNKTALLSARRLATLVGGVTLQSTNTSNTTSTSNTTNATITTNSTVNVSKPTAGMWKKLATPILPNATNSTRRKSLLGVGLSKRRKYATFNSTLIRVGTQGIPANYDLRAVAPQCVHAVGDQGTCGACWAFAVSTVLSDRLCLASPSNNINVQLSPQNMINCDLVDQGCGGGYLDYPWTYTETMGLPSEACQPYSSSFGAVGTCSSRCNDGTTPTLYYSIPNSARIFTDPASIKAEILAYGPVEAAMSVYYDFFQYSSGIYYYTGGDYQGAHVVKLIGWDFDPVIGNYWIAQNSWGVNWGERGYFKIKEGEVGIDSSAIAGMALVPPPPPPPPPPPCPTCPVCPGCSCNCGGGSGGGGGCFTGDMTVKRLNGNKVEDTPMTQLEAGDLIQVNDGTFEPVLAFFQHFELERTVVAFTATSSKGEKTTVKLTPEHYVYVTRGGQELHVASGTMRIGDKLKRRVNTGGFEYLTVSHLTFVNEIGHYNPMTPSQTLLVNGIHSSNYVEKNWDTMIEILMLFGRIHPKIAQFIIDVEKFVGLQA